MTENIDQQELQPAASGTAAIAAGILIIIAGFLVYNYFSKVGTTEEGIFTSEQGEVQVSDEAEDSAIIRETGTGGPEGETLAWQATDYQEGEISGDEYTVQWGDTLWEIAEARYGSGFEWGRVLEANQDNVGFLPNGSQALIVPGQILVLPN
ncbi:LysM peptidoglycan-binding domain-containing protein [Candidatus Parcubacteria bacterium]|nr:LysM peptidoglycan-binding domain-containing protein [Candidatus Parcubacteria bacterium]